MYKISKDGKKQKLEENHFIFFLLIIMLAYYFLNKEYSIHVHVKVIYLKEHNAQSVIDTISGEYTLVY